MTIDLARLHELVDAADLAAAEGNPSAALAAAEAGLELWESGPPPEARPGSPREAQPGSPSEAQPGSPEPGEAAGVHRVLVRARALALARLGESGPALPLLCALADELPRDEEVLLELLRLEPVDEALARYDNHRQQLVAELGINPGPELVLWHRKTLREAVASPPAAPAATEVAGD
ncbi:BTAD domain-containing putative transcriptional regulator [Cryptosporangium sp. NPDC051539]|uniref:BTAD domain-containing putative transcriptional regulator n=1 Tax=Cryptosporangium sp. NPDC051539 TaxID=3363962 RepID=UPI003793664A